jgi:hypothetical protein
MPNLFQDSTKSIPTSDSQIVRVDMETQEIGGRKSSLPSEGKSGVLPISHVPNAGTSK